MKSKSARATILILIALYLFFRWYFFPPLPTYSGSQQLVGLQEKVDIYTDEYGVPHIFAENEKDLFFTVGYIIARERLFQLSTVASAVRGELAAFFGDNALEDDIYLRTWGIPSISQKIVDGYNEETMMIAEAFCNGINAYIDEAGSRLPVEFKILRQKPIKWRPSDLAGHGRLMAHDLQQSWKAEIMFGLIQLYYGAEKTAELMPAYENHWPIIAAQEMNNIWEQFSEAVWDREQSMRNILGTNGMSIGSNSFVISGNLTQSGKPLLMNDPHLEFSQPGVWYEIHLNGGRFNVSGVCLVGLPVPIIGQNEHCAWGFTNIMADDIDFFIEKMHPENSHLYFYGDTWREMDIVEQSIPLQNGRDTTIVIRSTVHGPIISDIHPLLKNSEMAVSMSWTGHWETSELSALIKLNTMKNWDDFSSAARDFSVPGQNIVYADIEGNIGWRPAVKLPVRKDGNNLLPRPGHLPEYDWKGTVPFEEMPYIFNPEKGYIVTANQKTIDDSFPHYISNMWADPSRAMRMEELINEKKIIGVDDIKDIQGDITSSFARELTPYILNTEKGNETGNLKTAFDLLKNWDGNESAES
ncbi:MAG: penicillin acylase family protein, partial [Candidatus Marinimicrobia bacterium]|nr:penicillin acylase family protein [Candidatus Neomarinimicrobiota bacterium]